MLLRTPEDVLSTSNRINEKSGNRLLITRLCGLSCYFLHSLHDDSLLAGFRLLRTVKKTVQKKNNLLNLPDRFYFLKTGFASAIQSAPQSTTQSATQTHIWWSASPTRCDTECQFILIKNFFRGWRFIEDVDKSAWKSFFQLYNRLSKLLRLADTLTGAGNNRLQYAANGRNRHIMC